MYYDVVFGGHKGDLLRIVHCILIDVYWKCDRCVRFLDEKQGENKVLMYTYILLWGTIRFLGFRNKRDCTKQPIRLDVPLETHVGQQIPANTQRRLHPRIAHHRHNPWRTPPLLKHLGRWLILTVYSIEIWIMKTQSLKDEMVYKNVRVGGSYRR